MILVNRRPYDFTPSPPSVGSRWRLTQDGLEEAAFATCEGGDVFIVRRVDPVFGVVGKYVRGCAPNETADHYFCCSIELWHHLFEAA